MDDLIAHLAKRLHVPDADIVTGDEVRNWPDGKLQELLAEGILQEVELGTTVVCDQCDEHCSIKPQRRTDPQTGKVIGVHICMREEAGGRIEIDLDRLRRWRINKRKLSQLGYANSKGQTASSRKRKDKKRTDLFLLRTALLQHHGLVRHFTSTATM